MPKRCGCGDTCACVINPGPGIDIDGSGTVDHPYVITNAADSLSDQLVFDNSGNVDFVTVGDGTADSPLRVTANAALKLIDLTDVADTPAPTNGQTLVWNGTAWVPGAASGGGGAGADEVVIATAAPTPVSNLPELWVDLSSDPAPFPVGTWVDIPLTTWKSVNAASTAQYRVESNGMVRLRGTLTKVAGGNIAHGEVMFTLPVEARPLRPYYFPAMTSGYIPVRVDVQTTGLFTIALNTTIFTSPGANVAIDGISFDRSVA